jgi:hypothetical protein
MTAIGMMCAGRPSTSPTLGANVGRVLSSEPYPSARAPRRMFCAARKIELPRSPASIAWVSPHTTMIAGALANASMAHLSVSVHW